MIKLSGPSLQFTEKYMPLKWKKTISNYSISAEKIKDVSEWNKLVRSNIVNIAVFSVLIITIILLDVNVIQPYFWKFKWSRVISAIITIVAISPFLWALSFRKGNHAAYSKIWENSEYRGPLIIMQVAKIGLSVFYIGFLFDRLFSTQIALFGVSVTIILLFIFSKKIQQFYGRIEDRFMHNLNERELQHKEKFRNLTPWDTHISSFKLNPRSPLIGKTLLESKIREKFGVNIAAIEREDLTINVPDRFERLYPNDIILAIGTDAQLKKFKEFLERTEVDADILKTKNEIKLLHFSVMKDSVLIGKTIKDSNIRELTKGLVVGIERGSQRILNPESNEAFKPNDLVWIVGSEKRIKIIAQAKNKKKD
jgi:CPA2 family monovalent cation:H+ antiporter-2